MADGARTRDEGKSKPGKNGKKAGKKAEKNKVAKAATPKAPAPKPAPAAEQPRAAAAKAGIGHENLSYAEMMALLSPDQHRTLETLSQNLARAAVSAQSAIAE